MVTNFFVSCNEKLRPFDVLFFEEDSFLLTVNKTCARLFLLVVYKS